jgi:hypothetical protein
MSSAAPPSVEPAPGTKRQRTDAPEAADEAKHAEPGVCVWVIHGMDELEVWEFSMRHFGVELPEFSRFAYLVSRQNSRLEIEASGSGEESDDGTSSETTKCDADGDPLSFMAAIHRYREMLKLLKYEPSMRDEWANPARVVVSFDWD